MDKKILTINDTVHGLIEHTLLEKEIIASSLFNRLHDVYQNSTVYLTFPTNRTKRFEHSIGAMHLAGEMFFNSLYNTLMSGKINVIKNFLKTAKGKIDEQIVAMQQGRFDCDLIHVSNYLRLEYLNDFKIGDLNEADSEDLFDVHIQKKFKLFCTDNNNGEKITIEESNIMATIYQAVRIAALLHDIGHPPFSHITERALERVRASLGEMEEGRGRQFIKIFDNAKNLNNESDKNMQLHEVIGIKITHIIFDNLLKNSSNAHEYKKVAYRLLILFCVNSIMYNKDFWKDLHKLIDDSVDCDRLDYIVRDSNASGILGFQIDYSRIISGMQLQHQADQNKFVFAFVAKTINNIESFFLKRMELYKSLVFHHRVVKTDKLFSDVIETLSKRYLQENTNAGINQENWSNDISALWGALRYLNISLIDSSDQLLSWNDSWLLTVLKQEYFKLLKKANNNQAKDADYVLIDKLKEILLNKKVYFSVIKRNYDFDLLDKSCAEALYIGFSNNNIKVNNKNEYLDDLIKIIRNDRKLNIFKNYSPKIFIINFINRFIINTQDFKDIVLNCVEEAKEEFNKNHEEKIEDIFAEIKHVKNGISKDEVLLYRPHSKNDTLISLAENSNINEILLLNEFYTPSIYVYIKKCKTDNKLNDQEFLELFGKKLGEQVLKYIII